MSRPHSLRHVLPFLLVLSLSAGAALADVPDAWITTKVKTRLLTHDDVTGRHVNVDTDRGVVTLHGTVSSEAERRRALEQARRTEGVREVRDLLVVVPDHRRGRVRVADERLEERVEAAIESRRGEGLAEVRVKSVHGGVVLLTGTVASEHDHLHAISVAADVEGVRRVNTSIRSGDRRSDAFLSREAAEWNGRKNGGERDLDTAARDSWLTMKVKTRLLLDSDLPGTGVNVDTRRGVVTLFGTVDNRAVRALAENEVLSVDGVRGVRNQLQVVAPAAQQARSERDDETERALNRRLRGEEAFGDVEVDVEAGVARLTGTVPTPEARLRALMAVRGTKGVRSIVDELRIRRGDS